MLVPPRPGSDSYGDDLNLARPVVIKTDSNTYHVMAWEDLPPCISSIIGIYSDLIVILIIPYGH